MRTFAFPGFVPDYPPSPSVAQVLCDTFHADISHLEHCLNAAKRTARACHHQRDPNLLYKDTQRPQPEPVTSLLRTSSAVVTEVDAEDQALDFEPPCQFDVTKPVLIDNKPVGIIHACPFQILLALLSISILWGWPQVAGALALSWGAVCRIGEVMQAVRDDLVLPEDLLFSNMSVYLKVKEPNTRYKAARHQM